MIETLPGIARKITLTIPGKPQPGGSKRGVPGGKFTRIIDANPKAADWKRTVQFFAQSAETPMFTGPLRVCATFYLKRPAGHFGKKGLLPSARPFPSVAPDALKLMRSTEDALSGFCWVDDAQIVIEEIRKVYSEDCWTGAVIDIEEIAP